MLAKINGVFRLTRDAELTYTQTGTAIVKLGLACSEKFKEKETTLFIDAVAFSKPAELLNQYAGTKGTQISLAGKLHTDQWVDQNQQKRSKISMVIESFEFLSNKSGGNSYQQTPQQQTYGQNQPQTYNDPTAVKTNELQQQHQAQQQMPTSNEIPEIDIDEDEIPF